MVLWLGSLRGGSRSSCCVTSSPPILWLACDLIYALALVAVPTRWANAATAARLPPFASFLLCLSCSCHRLLCPTAVAACGCLPPRALPRRLYSYACFVRRLAGRYVLLLQRRREHQPPLLFHPPNHGVPMTRMPPTYWEAPTNRRLKMKRALPLPLRCAPLLVRQEE